MGIGHPPTAIHNVFQYGAPGGTRTLRIQVLNLARIPIPSPGQIQQVSFFAVGFEPTNDCLEGNLSTIDSADFFAEPNLNTICNKIFIPQIFFLCSRMKNMYRGKHGPTVKNLLFLNIKWCRLQVTILVPRIFSPVL